MEACSRWCVRGIEEGSSGRSPPLCGPDPADRARAHERLDVHGIRADDIRPTASAPTTSATAAPVDSLDRILYSMSGPHEGAPHGVPTSFSWATGPSLGAVTPPAGMSAITSWGQIYADTTNVHPANVRVELRNMETYVWSNSGTPGRAYKAQPASTAPTSSRTSPATPPCPPTSATSLTAAFSTGMVSGYNFHFWPTGSRGNLSNPADIGGVFTTLQARLILDDPNGPTTAGQARYLANTGADWWRDLSAPYGDGTNNPGVGKAASPTSPPTGPRSTSTPGGPIATAPGSGPKPNSPAIHRPSTHSADPRQRTSAWNR